MGLPFAEQYPGDGGGSVPAPNDDIDRSTEERLRTEREGLAHFFEKDEDGELPYAPKGLIEYLERPDNDMSLNDIANFVYAFAGSSVRYGDREGHEEDVRILEEWVDRLGTHFNDQLAVAREGSSDPSSATDETLISDNRSLGILSAVKAAAEWTLADIKEGKTDDWARAEAFVNALEGLPEETADLIMEVHSADLRPEEAGDVITMVEGAPHFATVSGELHPIKVLDFDKPSRATTDKRARRAAAANSSEPIAIGEGRFVKGDMLGTLSEDGEFLPTGTVSELFSVEIPETA